MGIILSTQDYNSIRGMVGIDKDVENQLTDDVIDELQFLPAAEAEALTRIGSSNFVLVMQLDPNNPNKVLFKTGTLALCCSNLCRRLEATIPTKQQLTDLGSIERVQINWKERWQLFRNDANYFFGLIDTTYIPHDFPPALALADGRVLPHDPQFHRAYQGAQVSDFGGYVGPSGLAYNVWIPDVTPTGISV